MPDTPTVLDGGGRFDITVAGDVVTKRGDPRALAREASGLRRAAGLGLAPRLLDAAHGQIVVARIDGAERRLDTLGASDARALGRTLRSLHDSRRGVTGGLAHWPSRARSLTAYRARRAADALAAAGPDHATAACVVAGLPALDAAGPGPLFRLLHGDLVASNILWTPAPQLIDFEFWRMGDPAEDLAYLIEVNALPPPAARALLDAYADPVATGRVPAWQALCALDAGLWYRDNRQPGRGDAVIARAVRQAGV